MAMYQSTPSGKRALTDGTPGQCRCGKPAETEIQIGWIPEANAGAGGGQYEQICWPCYDEDKAAEAADPDVYWRDVKPKEIEEVAVRLIQKKQPVQARVRNFDEDPWVAVELVGVRLNYEPEQRFVYFVDEDDNKWVFCQIHRQFFAYGKSVAPGNEIE